MMPERTISRAIEEVEEVKEVKEVEEKTGTGRSACATGVSREGKVEEETDRNVCPTAGRLGEVSCWISRRTWSGGRLRDLPRT